MLYQQAGFSSRWNCIEKEKPCLLGKILQHHDLVLFVFQYFTKGYWNIFLSVLMSSSRGCERAIFPAHHVWRATVGLKYASKQTTIHTFFHALFHWILAPVQHNLLHWWVFLFRNRDLHHLCLLLIILKQPQPRYQDFFLRDCPLPISNEGCWVETSLLGSSVIEVSKASREELAPRTRVSFRILVSRDFSRLHQMESLLAGLVETYRFSRP